MAVKKLVTKGGFVSAAEQQARKLQRANSTTYPADAKTASGGSHPNAGSAQSGGANVNGGRA